MRKLVMLLILGLLVSGCSRNIQEKLTKHVPFPKSTEILYDQTIEKGTITIYKDESGLRHAFMPREKDPKYWINSGNAELNPKDGFAWTMINDVNTPILTFAGVVTNDKITAVIIKQKTLEKKANIIQTEKGQKVWFTYFDTMEKQDAGKPFPIKIEVLSNDGEIIWKEGVYEGAVVPRCNNPIDSI